MNGRHFEIERKFVLDQWEDLIVGRRSRLIRQGYVIHNDVREVRVREEGGRYALTLKEGRGLTRKEVEVSLKRSEFEAIWAMTEGRRIEKLRYELRHGKHRIEVDVYRGHLEGLCTADVEFVSEHEANAFEAPEFLGREVTGTGEFRNVALAIHGLPYATPAEYRIGGVPFLFDKDRMQLVLVTRASRGGWIVPKGSPEENLSHEEVVLMECVEEAGVIGSVQHGIKSTCVDRDGRSMHLYAVRVSVLMKKWPEDGVRDRIVVPLDQAVKKIDELAVQKAIEEIATKILQAEEGLFQPKG